jgi:hypothetical protein
MHGHMNVRIVLHVKFLMIKYENDQIHFSVLYKIEVLSTTFRTRLNKGVIGRNL